MGKTGERGALPHGFDTKYTQLFHDIPTLLDAIAVLANRRLVAKMTDKSREANGFSRTLMVTKGEPEVTSNGLSVVHFSDQHPSHPGQTWFDAKQYWSLVSRPLAWPGIQDTVKPIHFAATHVMSLVAEAALSPLEISSRVKTESIQHLWSILPHFTLAPVPLILLNIDDRLITPYNTYVTAARARVRDRARGGLSDPHHTRQVFDMAMMAGFQGYHTPLELTEEGKARLLDGVTGADLGGYVKEHLQVCLMSPLGSSLMDLFGRVHVHLDGCYRLNNYRYVVYSLAVSGSASLSSFTVATLVTSDDTHVALVRMLRFVFDLVGFRPLHIMADMGKAEIKAIREAGCLWCLCMFHLKQALVVYFPASKSYERNNFLRLLNIAQAAGTVASFRVALSTLNDYVASSCPPKLQSLWRERYSTEEYVVAWASCYRPLVHPLVSTDMNLEAIFGVFKNSLALKDGRVGDFLWSLATTVFTYEVEKVTRFIVQSQRPATSVVSVNVKQGAKTLITTKSLNFDGRRYVTMPSQPSDSEIIFFMDDLATAEAQREALERLLKTDLPSRASARCSEEAASALNRLRDALTRTISTADKVISALSAVAEDGTGDGVPLNAEDVLRELVDEEKIWLELAVLPLLADLSKTHNSVETALTAAPGIIEHLSKLVGQVPRVARWQGGYDGSPTEPCATLTVDLMTFCCTCPSKNLPAALGCLCKHLLAVAKSGLLSEKVFEELVRIVDADHKRSTWSLSSLNAWTTNLSGHEVTFLGGSVYSCNCGYMRLALGRYCHFPLCPALTFLMIDRSFGWARGCLRYKGTRLGEVLETERHKRLFLLQDPLPPVFPTSANIESSGLGKFVPVRDKVGRRKT